MFNDMVDFIDNTAKNKETGTHQFAATGLLLENFNRERDHLTQSISHLKEQLVILGIDRRGSKREPFPLPLILQPFRPTTWIGFIVALFAVTVSLILTAYIFGSRPFFPRSLLTFVAHGYLDSDVAWNAPPQNIGEADSELMKRVDHRISTYNLARHLVRIALEVILIVFFLFYEMGAVNVLFVARSRPFLKDVSKLTQADLELYGIEMNAATEDIWNLSVFGDGTEYKNTFPWHRCSTESE